MQTGRHHVFCGICGQCRGIGCSKSALTDESDDEIDGHQDEDRTDPERTDNEGDI